MEEIDIYFNKKPLKISGLQILWSWRFSKHYCTLFNIAITHLILRL